MKVWLLTGAAVLSQCLYAQTVDIAAVDFKTSMQRNYAYDAACMKQDPQWQLMRKLYKNYQRLEKKEHRHYLIPPIVHFIWLGSPLPERCRIIIETWRTLHPNWLILLWTEKDIPTFKMKNKAIFDRAKNYGEKSDIWRYEILYRYGGVYADTDFECLKSFDHLNRTCEFYAGLGFGKLPFFYNGIIGCSPGHPILKQCVERLQTGPGDHNDSRIQTETGPFFFTRCFFDVVRKNSKGVVPFPVTFFYAFPNNKRTETLDRNLIKKKWVLPESMALHYWDVSWVDQSQPNLK